MNTKHKNGITNIAGSKINATEVKLYNDLAPYDWDHIHLRGKTELTAFHNVIYLLKHRPIEALPFPDEALPFLELVQRVYASIDRLNQDPPPPSSTVHTAKYINPLVVEFAKGLGVELVGFTTLEPSWVFPASENWASPIKYRPIEDTNVISLGMEMDYRAFNMNHFPDPETNKENARVYALLGEAVEKIAEFVRELGYRARGHHPFVSDLLHQPHAVKAGLGQLGANGLLLSKPFGPRQRLATVTTNAPIRVTPPKDLGADKLCLNCRRCVDTCPVSALSPTKINWRGTLKWKMNSKRCWPYYEHHNACGLCLSVCPWNKKNTWYHRAASETVKWSGLLRWALLIIDDQFYWKKALTNPKVKAPRREKSPLDFDLLLDLLGQERLDSDSHNKGTEEGGHEQG